AVTRDHTALPRTCKLGSLYARHTRTRARYGTTLRRLQEPARGEPTHSTTFQLAELEDPTPPLNRRRSRSGLLSLSIVRGGMAAPNRFLRLRVDPVNFRLLPNVLSPDRSQQLPKLAIP